MSRPTLLALAALACVPAAAFEPGKMPALEQAGSVGTKGAGEVYDNARSGGGVRVASAPGEATGGCPDETCGFRKGGPPPASLKKEPDTPFTGDINPDGTNKKSSSGGTFTWKTVAFTLVGAAAGAGVGFLIGGPMGALIGGVVGGLLGLLLNLFS
jgi:hypothetical protein